MNKKDPQKYTILYFNTPTRTRLATQYFFQYPTRPDIEKPYLLDTACTALQIIALEEPSDIAVDPMKPPRRPPRPRSTFLTATAAMGGEAHSCLRGTFDLLQVKQITRVLGGEIINFPL